MAGESVPGGRSSAITRASSWRGTPELGGAGDFRVGCAAFSNARATPLDFRSFFTTSALRMRPGLACHGTTYLPRAKSGRGSCPARFPLDAAARIGESHGKCGESHQCPDAEVRKSLRHILLRTSESKGH